MAGPCRSRDFDWPTLIRNKDKEIARLEAAYVSTLQKAKVEIVRQRAVIEDAHTIRLADDDARDRRENSDRHRRLALPWFAASRASNM